MMQFHSSAKYRPVLNKYYTPSRHDLCKADVSEEHYKLPEIDLRLKNSSHSHLLEQSQCISLSFSTEMGTISLEPFSTEYTM